jgi:hypothetical protein
VVDAVTFLVREVGWGEAKKYVSEDAEVLAEAAEEVLVSALPALTGPPPDAAPLMHPLRLRRGPPLFRHRRRAAFWGPGRAAARGPRPAEALPGRATPSCSRARPPARPPPTRQAIREAEAAAAAAAAAEAAAAEGAEGDTARALDALRRSPLMLELSVGHPGLPEVATMVSLVS